MTQTLPVAQTYLKFLSVVLDDAVNYHVNLALVVDGWISMEHC